MIDCLRIIVVVSIQTYGRTYVGSPLSLHLTTPRLSPLYYKSSCPRLQALHDKKVLGKMPLLMKVPVLITYFWQT